MTEKPSYIAQHAPWPASEEDVTAAALCKALTARAYAIDTYELLAAAERAPEAEKVTARRYCAARFSAKARTLALVYALRQIPDRQLADETASHIWGMWKDGALDEWLWDWLTEYGLDPEQCRPTPPVREGAAT